MSHPSRVRVTGPLAAHARGFAAELSRQGYRRKPVADQIRLLAHLSRWLLGKGLDTSNLTVSVLNEFLGARRSQGYTLWLSPKALAPLTSYLRGSGVAVCEHAPALSPIEALLWRYREYLVGTRGLTKGSARGYIDMVWPFVGRLLVDGELDWASVRAADVNAFVLAACRGRSIGSAKLVTRVDRRPTRTAADRLHDSRNWVAGKPVPTTGASRCVAPQFVSSNDSEAPFAGSEDLYD